MSLDSASCRIGTVEALYARMNGGVVPGRRVPQQGLRDAGDLRERQVLVDVRLEEILDHRDAVQRLRLGVLDIVDGGLRGALGVQHDAVGHVLGRQPV